MRGRDGILVLLVMLVVGGLSILGYWIGSGANEAGAPDPVAVADAPSRIEPSAETAAGAAPSVQSDAPADAAPAAGADASAERVAGLPVVDSPPPPVTAAEAGAPAPALDDRIVDAAREETVPVDAPGRGASRASDVRVADAPTPNDSQTASSDETLDRSSAQPERVAAAAPAEPTADSSDQEDRPSFDLVRVARDGSTVLAGRAQPGSVVSVLLDGELAAEVRADRRGEFVALVDAAFGDRDSRSLMLSSQNADGQVLLAAAPVILTKPSDPGAAPVVVRPSEAGAVVIQPGRREADTDVSIDAVSYDERGAVVVAGRGEPGSTARIYLDNSLSAEAQVNPDGEWRVRVAQEIAPAIYTLRVDQLSTAGIVTGRAETPFERAPVEDIVLQAGNVVVQPGNNLWRIATYVYGDGLQYTVIYDGNRDQIRDPDLIYPGQILDLPGASSPPTD